MEMPFFGKGCEWQGVAVYEVWIDAVSKREEPPGVVRWLPQH
jgi:hypothetical protein